jgi:hypothetical protein
MLQKNATWPIMVTLLDHLGQLTLNGVLLAKGRFRTLRQKMGKKVVSVTKIVSLFYLPVPKPACLGYSEAVLSVVQAQESTDHKCQLKSMTGTNER